MDVQRLETFVAVARSTTLAEAADRLGYARSTVTSHVQALERSLGAQLLERGASMNRLTKAGTRFLEYATDILDRLAQAQAAVAAAAQDRPSSLSIGATASLCTYRLPGFLRTLRRLMPQLETQVFVGSVAELRDQVGRGELSAALVNSATVPPGHRPAGEENRRHLWTDQVVLVGTPEQVARPQRLLVTAPGCVYRDIAEQQALPSSDASRSSRWAAWTGSSPPCWAAWAWERCRPSRSDRSSGRGSWPSCRCPHCPRC